MAEWVALCWGGPLDGQLVASPCPTLEAARWKPLRLMVQSTTEEATMPYYRDRYTYERFQWRGYEFYAWVIWSPAEHREAVIETIVRGLNLIAIWASI